MTETIRLLCIDYGPKFTGFAVANFPGITARALPTIDMTRTDVLQHVAAIIAEENIRRMLLGMPLSEKEGEIHRQIKDFRKRLESAFPDVTVEYTDESYSSQEADDLVRETGIGRKKKGRQQDSEAAKLVLLRYLRAHE